MGRLGLSVFDVAWLDGDLMSAPIERRAVLAALRTPLQRVPIEDAKPWERALP